MDDKNGEVKLSEAINNVDILYEMDIPDEQASLNVQHTTTILDYDVQWNTNFNDISSFASGPARYKEEATRHCQLNWWLNDANKYFSLLYTWRCVSRAIPPIKSNDDKKDAVNSATITVLEPYISELLELKEFVSKTVKLLIQEVICFRKNEFISDNYIRLLTRSMYVLLLLDELKNMKSSMKNDVSFYNRALRSTLLQHSNRDKNSPKFSEGEVNQLSLFLASRDRIRTEFFEQLKQISQYEEILLEIIQLNVKNLERRNYLFSLERHMIILSLSFSLSLLLLSDSPKYSMNKLDSKKRLSINKLDKLFHQIQIIPLYGDMQFSPFLYLLNLRESSFDCSRFTLCQSIQSMEQNGSLCSLSLANGITVTTSSLAHNGEVSSSSLAAYSTLPPQSTILDKISSLRTDYQCLVNTISLLASEYQTKNFVYSHFISMNCLVTERNNLSRFLANFSLNQKLTQIVLDSLRFMTTTTTIVHEFYSWRLAHPTSNRENNKCSKDADEYERVTRYNYTSPEKDAINQCIVMVKSIQSLLNRFEYLFLPNIRRYIYVRLQSFLFYIISRHKSSSVNCTDVSSFSSAINITNSTLNSKSSTFQQLMYSSTSYGHNKKSGSITRSMLQSIIDISADANLLTDGRRNRIDWTDKTHPLSIINQLSISNAHSNNSIGVNLNNTQPITSSNTNTSINHSYSSIHNSFHTSSSSSNGSGGIDGKLIDAPRAILPAQQEISPSSTQLHMIELMMKLLLQECQKKNNRKEFDSPMVEKLEQFHQEIKFWNYLLNYHSSVKNSSDFSFLWFREFFLEMTMGKKVQFPIETSMPWLLVDYCLTHANRVEKSYTLLTASFLEHILYIFDIYNDIAYAALVYPYRSQFLYDEIEAEANVAFTRLMFSISSIIFREEKRRTSNVYISSTLRRELERLGIYFPSDGLILAENAMMPSLLTLLINQRHVEILGRCVNLHYVIASNVDDLFRRSIKYQIDKFCNGTISDVIELEMSLDIYRHSHEKLSYHLTTLTSFDELLNEVNRTVSRPYGRIASQLIWFIHYEFPCRYSFRSVDDRFVRVIPPNSVLPNTKKSQRIDEQLSSFGSKSLNVTLKRLFERYENYLDGSHFRSMIRLLKYEGLSLLINELIIIITNLLKNDIVQHLILLRPLMPPHFHLPLTENYNNEGILIYYLTNLSKVIECRTLRSDILDTMRQFGNCIIFCLFLEDNLVIEEIFDMQQGASFVNKQPKIIGSGLEDEETLRKEMDKLTEHFNYRTIVDNIGNEIQSELAYDIELLTQERLSSGLSLFDHILQIVAEILKNDENFQSFKTDQISGLLNISNCFEFHRIWSAILFSIVITMNVDNEDKKATIERIYGDGLFWCGCVLIHLMDQQRRFNLLDFSYHLLQLPVSNSNKRSASSTLSSSAVSSSGLSGGNNESNSDNDSLNLRELLLKCCGNMNKSVIVPSSFDNLRKRIEYIKYINQQSFHALNRHTNNFPYQFPFHFPINSNNEHVKEIEPPTHASKQNVFAELFGVNLTY
ncbi:hypothetical protein SNEBB_000126 [Seison nebaliae]|nr:hypothetical protein SNEBB_000126 [Seison nebaliae]